MSESAAAGHSRVRRGRRVRISPPPASVLVLLAIVGMCLLAPLVSRQGATGLDPANAFGTMSARHWLGTDELGRDKLSRLLYGGELSLSVAGGSVAVAFLAGTLWGVLASGARGLLDELLMRGADITMAIPQILFALVCVAAFGASLVSLIVLTGLLLAPSTARMARAAIVRETTLDYYAAAVAYGASRGRLLLREVLPNILPDLASQAAINAASAMILEASLSFVGLGVQPPQMSWGVLLQQGYGFLYNDPSYAAAPAILILATVLCLNLAADRLTAVDRLTGGRR
ncbi:ABC transporter permease [Frankia sp. Cj3]|uniref:ABC transporter permease n=1 Tax=Frankia sp. Cj3 TaxID=2880976 RepID=UPI001EF71A34|nr:ABC transporter permease [Frankia sp. Cj3]